jgi:hypothetical protein
MTETGYYVHMCGVLVPFGKAVSCQLLKYDKVNLIHFPS